MDYKNIDLDSHEIDTNIFDPLTFSDLLLEIDCNIQDISINSVMNQFIDDLKRITEDAKYVFLESLPNIIKKAKETRAQK